MSWRDLLTVKETYTVSFADKPLTAKQFQEKLDRAISKHATGVEALNEMAKFLKNDLQTIDDHEELKSIAVNRIRTIIVNSLLPISDGVIGGKGLTPEAVNMVSKWKNEVLSPRESYTDELTNPSLPLKSR